MGRHNKSNGRAPDPTYDYDEFDNRPGAGPRPAWGVAKKNPVMTHEEWKAIVAKRFQVK